MRVVKVFRWWVYSVPGLVWLGAALIIGATVDASLNLLDGSQAWH
jgi:hypothetical protein